MIDSDFRIERPKRYYRQGLNLLTHPDEVFEEEKGKYKSDPNHDTRSQSGTSIKSRISRIFGHHHTNKSRSTHHQRASSDGARTGTINSRPSHARSSSVSYNPTSDSDDDTGEEEEEDEGRRLQRQITPMLDPSTNTNPLEGPDEKAAGEKDRKKKRGDVSKHTFYIENSQMRLKCYAKNEVGSGSPSLDCYIWRLWLEF